MKLEITIPTKLSEIKLSQYQAFLKIAKDNEDEQFLQHKMVQIFCGIDLKDIATIKYKDVQDITNKIGAMFTQENKLIQRFKLGGVEFGFIPNLEDISFGEYTDLDTYIVDWNDYHKAMAVLYRPIKKNGLNGTYEIEEYNGSITYSDVMKHAPLDVCLGATVFFYNLGNALLKGTIHYLENNKEVQNILQQQTLANDGDGIVQSMLLLKETLENLTTLQDYRLTSV
ncbi:MAG: hypothetical protein RL308_2511 [Bacteroidota bacterium]|jgi:hypothetical protein